MSRLRFRHRDRPSLRGVGGYVWRGSSEEMPTVAITKPDDGTELHVGSATAVSGTRSEDAVIALTWGVSGTAAGVVAYPTSTTWSCNVTPTEADLAEVALVASTAGVTDTVAITVAEPVAVVLWQDMFARPPGPPGNGWIFEGGPEFVHYIEDEALVRPGSWVDSVSRNDCGAALPVNYYVEATIPHSALSQRNFGIAARYSGGTCVKVLFVPDSWTVQVGEGRQPDSGLVTPTITGGFPDSWFANQNHKIGLHANGTHYTVYFDDVAWGEFDCAANAGVAGSIAIIGDGRLIPWLDMTVSDVPTPLPAPEPYIEFRTTGATFSPLIEVAEGATIEWIAPDGLTSNVANPTFNFGSEATRYTRLRVTPWSALTMVNIGYGADDGGPAWIPLHPTQPVTRVSRLSLATSLRVFAARSCPLSELDVTGCSSVEYWELYTVGSLQHLTGLETCSGTKRLVVEGSSLLDPKLDLSRMPELEDLRARSPSGVPLIDWGDPATGPGPHVWHICSGYHVMDMSTRDFSRFPALTEFWVPRAHMAGTLAFTAANAVLDSVDASENDFDTLNVAGAFSAGRSAAVNLASNPLLTSVDVSGCPGLAFLTLTGAALPQAVTDDILVTMNGYGTSGGAIDLSGGTSAAPSAVGLAAKASLEGRGWTVTVNA